MANLVICEQYTGNSNIENHLQKVLASTEHLLRWIPRRELLRYKNHPLSFQFCMNGVFQSLY